MDNVIIRNANFVSEDHDGEPVLCIQSVGMRHKAIAQGRINQSGTLNGQEIRFLRTEMGMTQSELAELVNRDIQSVGRWGRNKIVLEPKIDISQRQLVAERLELALEGSITSLIRLGRYNATPAQIKIEKTTDAKRPYAPAA